jgi:hypothetical protein
VPPVFGQAGAEEDERRVQLAGQQFGGAATVNTSSAGRAQSRSSTVKPALRVEQVRQMRRPGLLLAFDQELEVDGGCIPAGGGQVGPDAPQVGDDLALRVGADWPACGPVMWVSGSEGSSGGWPAGTYPQDRKQTRER